MKHLKYLLSFLIIGILSIPLASCSGDDDDDYKGKFQPISINGITYYNCIGGFVYIVSTYGFEEEYVTRIDGHYTQFPAVKFHVNLYDEPDIESDNLASIDFVVPRTSFSNGSNITNDFCEISVRPDLKGWDANTKDEYKVLSGKASLKNISGGKATVVFDNYKISIDDESVTLNGTVTCEE